MTNLMISSRNYADAAVLTAVSGSFVSTLPLANLQDPRLSVVARADTGYFQILADLGSAKPVRVVALAGHTFSKLSSITVAAGNTLPLGSYSYVLGGTYCWLEMPDEEMAEYTGLALRIADGTPYQYWRVGIGDPLNFNTHVDIGRLWIGDGWQPGDERGIAYGCKWAYDDPSTSVVSRGGAEYFDLRPKQRVLTISHDALTKAEGMDGVLGLQRRIGKSGQALVVFDPDETGPDLIRLSMLCRRTGNDGLTWINPVDWGGSEEFREVVG